MKDVVAETILGMEVEKGRWILIILGMIINLCLGTIYSWSVFVAPLTTYFTKTLGQTVTANDILLPFSVFLAFFAIAMPLTGKYIEQYGPRNITIVGGVLTGLGWLLASVSTSVPMLYIMYGIVGGIGVGIAYGVPVAVAARWFPDKRGLAVGLTVLGFGFSAFFTANIAGYLISAYGVMPTFRIFGIVFIILTIILALPLKFPRTGWVPAGWTPPAPKQGEQKTCELTRSQMLKTSSFYALWACYFIGCLAGLMAISIAKPVGTDVGIETGLATVSGRCFCDLQRVWTSCLWCPHGQADPTGYCHGVVQPYRRGIASYVADPDCDCLPHRICCPLGVSGGLAGHSTDIVWHLLWHL